ncbi:MAG: glycosyltransferase family 4 protein [Patescibacteria group bacterium]
MKMKIAHITCQLPPDAGGIGMVAHSYADQLFERGHEVCMFVPKSKRDLVAGKRYQVKVLRPWFKLGHGAVLPQLFWRLWNFDIVHLHYPFFGSAFIVAFLKLVRKDKIKLILSYHMDVNLIGWRKLYEIITRKFFGDLILRLSDKIIVSSDDYAENSRLQGFYFKNINKFIELPFGVPKKFHPEKKNLDLLKRYCLNEADKVVGFVGGLDQAHYFKGVNVLIKAFANIEDKNVKALIIGSGNLTDDYKKLVDHLKLNDRIKFAGFGEPTEMPDNYNLFDIFVLPSINSSEAFGIVLIEAMACGKPVIASNLKGVRSVVDPGVNGLLVEPSNSRDISDKIKFLFEHEELMLKFSQQCVASVEKKYRWQIIIDQLEQVYQDCLKKT